MKKYSAPELEVLQIKTIQIVTASDGDITLDGDKEEF